MMQEVCRARHSLQGLRTILKAFVDLMHLIHFGGIVQLALQICTSFMLLSNLAKLTTSTTVQGELRRAFMPTMCYICLKTRGVLNQNPIKQIKNRNKR